MADTLPRMYGDLADWFHLVTPPEDYAEEADFYLGTINAALDRPAETLLELGSGGGNNAWHYKHHVVPVLVDLAPDMLELSRRLHPEIEHQQGDMRTVRLGREFDAVFVHDAVVYLTTLDDLRQAMVTAYVHLRPGGVVLFAPDHIRENFVASSEHGGNDGDGRALRYLEWTWDPDPTDNVYYYEFVYLLHEDGRPPQAHHDLHTCGLFSREEWLQLLEEVGFERSVHPFQHSEVDYLLEVFVGVKPSA